MKCGVQRIISREGRATALVLDSGEEVTADHVISSIGAPETATLIARGLHPAAGEPNARSTTGGAASNGDQGTNVGRLSFVETISVLNQQPADLGWGADTIIFFNDSAQFEYECPQAQVDPRSGVICIPNNFDFGADRQLPEGILRVTCLANFERWAHLPEDQYQSDKQRWFAAVQGSAQRFLPPLASPELLTESTIATDMFTPRTITKYTGHIGGAIYGAPRKERQGRTDLDNLYLCGTDQGFLGIVGAMLSGISMANYHILQKETARVSG